MCDFDPHLRIQRIHHFGTVQCDDRNVVTNGKCDGLIVHAGYPFETLAMVLPSLLWLLEHQKKNIRKEACWTISNVTAGTSDQIERVVESGIFPKLIEMLTNAEFDIQKEAAWAVSNATSGGSTAQIIYIVQQGALPPLVNLLSVNDTKIVTVALEGIENILKEMCQMKFKLKFFK